MLKNHCTNSYFAALVFCLKNYSDQLRTVKKNCSTDRAKFKKSLEHFLGTEKGMNNVWVPKGPKGLEDSGDPGELEGLEGSGGSEGPEGPRIVGHPESPRDLGGPGAMLDPRVLLWGREVFIFH